MFTKALALVIALCLFPLLSWSDVGFDGVDDSLSSAGGTTLADFITASTGSMLVWVKPEGTTVSGGSQCYFGPVILFHHAGYFGIVRNRNVAGTPDDFGGYNWDGSQDCVKSPVTIGAWTHLALVHSGGNIIFYVNGVSAGSLASGDTESMAGPLRLAGGFGITEIFQGVVAVAETYKTALSATEIGAIAKSRLHGIGSSAPAGSWNFDSCGDGVDCSPLEFQDASASHIVLTTDGTTGRASTFVTYPWGVE